MAGFNLTAQLNLVGPTNVKKIASDIRRDLSAIDTNVNVKVDPKSVALVKQLTGNINQLSAGLKEISGTAKQVSTDINKMGTSLNSVKTDRVAKDTQQAAKATQKLGEDSRSAARDVKVMGTELAEFGRQSGLAIRRFAAFSLVSGIMYKMNSAVNSSIDSFIAFDKELVRLSQVTGKDVKQLEGLVKTLRGLSTGLGVSSDELIKVTSTLAQAGLTARQTEEALKALALSVNAPSFDNLTDTTEGVIAAMRQFNIDAKDLTGVLGSINAVSAQFAVEAGDIIKAIQRTGGVFASASKGVAEGTDALNQFIAIFTQVRATTRESAETIATGLRTIFARIQRKDSIESLREFGVELTDLEGKFVGPYEAIARLSAVLNQLDPRSLEVAKITEELGGFRQIGKVIPLIQQFSTAQAALNAAQAGSGSLLSDNAKAQQALAVQLTKVREEFKTLISDIGDNAALQAFLKITLSLTTGVLKLAQAGKSLFPILTVIAGMKAVSAITEFTGGFLQGIDRVPNGPEGKKQSRSRTVGAGISGLLTGSGSSDNSREFSDLSTQINSLIPIIGNMSAIINQQIAETNANTAALTINTASIDALAAVIQASDTTGLYRGGKVMGFKTGGLVPGNGGGDRVPALLEGGEVVMSRDAVKRYGAGNLVRMNKYLGGGAVESSLKDLGMDKIAPTIPTDLRPVVTAKDVTNTKIFPKEIKLNKSHFKQMWKTMLVEEGIRQEQIEEFGRSSALDHRSFYSEWSMGNAFESEIVKRMEDGKLAKRKQKNTTGDTLQQISDGHYAPLDFTGGDAKFVKNIKQYDTNSGRKQILSKRFRDYNKYSLNPKPSTGKDKWNLGNTNIYVPGEGDKEAFRAYVEEQKRLAGYTYRGQATKIGRERLSSDAADAQFGFMAGGIADDTSPEYLDSLIQRIKDVGGAAFVARQSGITNVVERNTLQKKTLNGVNIKLGRNIDTVLQYLEKAETAAGVKAVEAQKEFEEKRKGALRVQLAAMFPIGHKWDEVYELGGRKVNLVARGLDEKYRPTVERMQEAASNLATNFAADIQSTYGETPNLKSVTPEQDKVFGQPQIEGLVVEKALYQLGAALVPGSAQNRRIDYMGGLGDSAKYFTGLSPTDPTEVKRIIDNTSLFNVREKITNGIAENLFASGGLVQEFAKGGSADRLVQDLQTALKEYTLGDHKTINSSLRKDETLANADSKIKQTVSSLDELMKYDVPSNLYAGIGSGKTSAILDYAEWPGDYESLIGQYIDFADYFSTSTNRDVADLFAGSERGSSMLDIKPKGKGIDVIQAYKDFGLPVPQIAENEEEFILPRGSSFRIDNAEGGDGTYFDLTQLKLGGLIQKFMAGGGADALYATLLEPDKTEYYRYRSTIESDEETQMLSGMHDALKNYTEDSSGINLGLSGKRKLYSGQKKTIASLDTLFDHGYYPPEDLYAGFGANRTKILTGGLDHTNPELRDSILENKGPVSFPGYFSTSASRNVAGRFKGSRGSLVTVDAKRPVIDVIKAAVDLGMRLPATLSQELEYILPKNSRFSIEDMGFGEDGSLSANLKQLKIGGLIQKLAGGGESISMTELIEQGSPQLRGRPDSQDELRQYFEDMAIGQIQSKLEAQKLLGKKDYSKAMEYLIWSDQEDQILKSVIADAQEDPMYGEVLSEFEGKPMAPRTKALVDELLSRKLDLYFAIPTVSALGPNITPELLEEGIREGYIGSSLGIDVPSSIYGDKKKKEHIPKGDYVFFGEKLKKFVTDKDFAKIEAKLEGSKKEKKLRKLDARTEANLGAADRQGEEILAIDLIKLFGEQQRAEKELMGGSEADRLEQLASMIAEGKEDVPELGGDPDLAKRTNKLITKWNSAAKKGDWTRLGLEQSAIDAILEDINDSNIFTALSGGKLARAAGKFKEDFALALAGKPLNNAQSARDLQQIVKAITVADYASGGLVQGFEEGGSIEATEKPAKDFGQILLSENGSGIEAKYAANENRTGFVKTKFWKDNLYTVGLSKATSGYGPRLYDVAMEAITAKGGMLTSDRATVSGDARKVWDFYFKNRSDVNKTPLPRDQWTGNYALVDEKLRGPKETWPSTTDPAWVLQTGYSKSPSLINDPNIVKRVKGQQSSAVMALSYFSRRNGGSIGKFAAGGTVPAMVSNGEAFVPPETAKKIGYAKLEKMNQADRNGMTSFAGGGISVFKGPGHGTSDSIGPVGLPVGSFVIREKATKALGLNRGGAIGIRHFADGGASAGVDIVMFDLISREAEAAGMSLANFVEEVKNLTNTIIKQEMAAGKRRKEARETAASSVSKKIAPLSGEASGIGKEFLNAINKISGNLAEPSQSEILKGTIDEGGAKAVNDIIDEYRQKLSSSLAKAGASVELYEAKMAEFEAGISTYSGGALSTRGSNYTAGAPEAIAAIDASIKGFGGTKNATSSSDVASLGALEKIKDLLGVYLKTRPGLAPDTSVKNVSFDSIGSVVDHLNQLSDFDPTAFMQFPETLVRLDKEISAAEKELEDTLKTAFSEAEARPVTTLERKEIANSTVEVKGARDKLEQAQLDRTFTQGAEDEKVAAAEEYLANRLKAAFSRASGTATERKAKADSSIEIQVARDMVERRKQRRASTLAEKDAQVSAAETDLADKFKTAFREAGASEVAVERSPEVQAARAKVEELKSSKTSKAVGAGMGVGLEGDAALALTEYYDKINELDKQIASAAENANKAAEAEAKAVARQKQIRAEELKNTSAWQKAMSDRMSGAQVDLSVVKASAEEELDLNPSAEAQQRMQAAAEATAQTMEQSVIAAEQLRQKEAERAALAGEGLGGGAALEEASRGTDAGQAVAEQAQKAREAAEALSALKQQAIRAGEARAKVATGAQRSGESDEDYQARYEGNLMDQTRRSAKELGLVKTRVMSPREAAAEAEKAQKAEQESKKETEQKSAEIVVKAQDLLIQAINENTKAVSGNVEATTALESEMAALETARSEVQARNQEGGDTSADSFDINDAFEGETYTITALDVIDDFGAMMQEKANGIAAAFTDLEGNTSAFGGFIQGLGGKLAAGADAAKAGLASVNEQFINSKVGGVFKGLSSLGGLLGGFIGTAGLTMAGEAAGGYDSAMGGSLLVGADIASAATAFATAGSALGPFGTAVGAVAGSVYGLVDGIAKWQDALEESRLAALEDAATRAAEQATMDFGVFFDSVEPDFDDFASGIQNLNEVILNETEQVASKMKGGATKSTLMGFGKEDLKDNELTDWSKEMASLNARAGAISKDVIRRFMSAGKSVEEVAGILGPQQFEAFKEQIAQADATYQRQVAEAAQVAKSEAELVEATQEAKDAAFERSVSDLKVKEANEDFAKNVTEVRKRLESTGVGILEKIIGNTPEENEKYAKSLSMASQLMAGNTSAYEAEQEKAFNEAYNQAGGGIEGQKAGEAAAAQVRKETTAAGNELLSLGDPTSKVVREERARMLRSQLESQGIDPSQGLAAKVLESLEGEDPTLEAQKNTAANTELLTKQMAELLGKNLALEQDSKQQTGDRATGFKGFYNENETSVKTAGALAVLGGAASLVPGVRRGTRRAYGAARDRVRDSFRSDAELERQRSAAVGSDSEGAKKPTKPADAPETKPRRGWWPFGGGDPSKPKPTTKTKAPVVPEAPSTPKPRFGGSGTGGRKVIGTILGLGALAWGASRTMGGETGETGGTGGDMGDTGGEGDFGAGDPEIISLLAAIEQNTYDLMQCCMSGGGFGGGPVDMIGQAMGGMGGGAFSIPPETQKQLQEIAQPVTQSVETEPEKTIGEAVAYELGTSAGLQDAVPSFIADAVGIQSAVSDIRNRAIKPAPLDITADTPGAKFYKGGQFLPGGGRAPKGGTYAMPGGLPAPTAQQSSSVFKNPGVMGGLNAGMQLVGATMSYNAMQNQLAEGNYGYAANESLGVLAGGLNAAGAVTSGRTGLVLGAAGDAASAARNTGRLFSGQSLDQGTIVQDSVSLAGDVTQVGAQAAVIAPQATAKAVETVVKAVAPKAAASATGTIASTVASKVAPGLAIADIAYGAYKGVNDEKAATNSNVVNASLGALTGSAHTGDSVTGMVANSFGGNIESGSTLDMQLAGYESMGRGAAIGGAIGSIIPGAGTAVGAAVGAGVGGGVEVVKGGIEAGTAAMEARKGAVKYRENLAASADDSGLDVRERNYAEEQARYEIDLAKAKETGDQSAIEAAQRELDDNKKARQAKRAEGNWLPTWMTGNEADSEAYVRHVERYKQEQLATQEPTAQAAELIAAGGPKTISEYKQESDSGLDVRERSYAKEQAMYENDLARAKEAGDQSAIEAAQRGLDDNKKARQAKRAEGNWLPTWMTGNEKDSEEYVRAVEQARMTGVSHTQPSAPSGGAMQTPVSNMSLQEAQGIVANQKNIDTSNLYAGGPVGAGGIDAALNQYDQIQALDEAKKVVAANEAANVAMDMVPQAIGGPGQKTGGENLIGASQQTSGGGVSTGSGASDMQAAASQVGTTIAATFGTGATDALQATFGGFIEQLGAIQFPQVPDVINMQGTHTVEVIINGAEAFKGMQESIKTMITEEIHKNTKWINNQTEGGLGP